MIGSNCRGSTLIFIFVFESVNLKDGEISGLVQGDIVNLEGMAMIVLDRQCGCTLDHVRTGKNPSRLSIEHSATRARVGFNLNHGGTELGVDLFRRELLGRSNRSK